MAESTPTPDYDRSHDFDQVFDVIPGAWSPRPAIYAQAVEAAEATGSLPPSPQAVYRALRLRGFRETTRKGIRGFKDIQVAERFQDAGRIVADHTASAYANRRDRDPEARAAFEVAYRTIRQLDKLRREDHASDPARRDQPLRPLRSQLTPWAIQPPAAPWAHEV